ncbi:hypothetical protein EXIGLDRAFT_729289 [Exidia glandulosa HHB12029]|uniref:TOG domain-containing protein n=1 Tax=Exidia glandulosa HHB12029 TaxID=1314781 RepID=A0A165ZHL0_EXIGL|nr:hypothetical protein EXIGLDRAFT_729289 [Exidia glandulosa HHB12029]
MAHQSVDMVSILPQRFFRLDDAPPAERLLLLQNILRIVNSTERIRDSDDVLRALEGLAVRLMDPSADCAHVACEIIMSLTLRVEHNRLARYRASIVPPLFRAFARPDGEGGQVISETLDAIYATTTLSALTEGISQALQSRDPRVLLGTLEFVQRCTAATPFAPVDIFSRMLAYSIVQLIIYPAPDDVQKRASDVLGALLRVVGLNVLIDTLRPLDPAQYTLVYEASQKAKVKSCAKEEIPDRLPDPPEAEVIDPKLAFGTSTAHVGPSWQGFGKIRHHFVFGDSLSSVGYRASPAYPQPRIAEPLGVPYPGETYAEGENWIGALVRECKSADALAYVYARPGDTVPLLANQVRNEFMRHTMELEPADGTLWTGSDSIFWTFIGTNDCGARGALFNVQKNMETLVELQEELYQAGARTFIFVTTMPVDRSPFGIKTTIEQNLAERVQQWNAGLFEAVSRFQHRHSPECTVMVYDAHAFFVRLIEAPTAYGMTNSGVGGGLWVDEMHPTAHVQRLLAKDIRAFLDSIGAFSYTTPTRGPSESDST